MSSIENKKNTNVICVGSFGYPKGMAGTKRVQHIIGGIKNYPNISVKVVILRQSSKDNVLSGFHRGVHYETVMGDLLRGRLIAMFPIFNIKSMSCLERHYEPRSKNIIYYYGPPNSIDILILKYAKRIGYKIIFDIVEDYDYMSDISQTIYSKIKLIGIRRQIKKIKELASGMVVISKHLFEKYETIANGNIPIHYCPVTVDMNLYPFSAFEFKNPVTLFYSGSFGEKDGVLNLISAFDLIAEKNPALRLVLTGKGSTKALFPVMARINESPYKSRIDYKGYLNDHDYYSTLNSIDIPCMTRIDHPYAHAGFPFKLGEYLASGKPVIASRISDVESLLRDRFDAILVKPGDIADIVAAVDYLLKYPDKAKSIGENGRKSSEKNFDYKKQGQRMIAFLAQI